jgi:hypothetical protein
LACDIAVLPIFKRTTILGSQISYIFEASTSVKGQLSSLSKIIFYHEVLIELAGVTGQAIGQIAPI